MRRTVVLLLTISVLFGCRRQEVAEHRPGMPQPAQVTTITMATFSKSLGNGAFYVARRFKWYETDPRLRNYRFRYAEFNDRPAINLAFDTGQLQVLFASEIPAMLCRSQGSDIRMIGIAANVRIEMISRKQSNIKTVQDLKGQDVAYLPGSSSHFGLLRALSRHEVTPADVRLRNMTPPEAKVAFENGTLDAWAIWSPFVEQELLNGTAAVIPGSEVYVANVITVSLNLTQGDRAATDAILAITERAKEWIRSHPSEAIKLLSEELNLEEPVVAAAMPRFDFAATLNAGTIANYQDKADFLAAEKLTRNSARLDVAREFIANQYIQR